MAALKKETAEMIIYSQQRTFLLYGSGCIDSHIVRLFQRHSSVINGISNNDIIIL